MKQSQLFTKTRKEIPKDETSKNAELLIRAGFVHKEMAGVYAFLPLGLRVMNKIEGIVREEMNAIGGQELSMTALQDKEVWEKTGRWDDAVVDIWFKTKLKNEAEIALAMTHEEPLTNIMKEYVQSFRDLPIYAYQFQNKFRNETRAKSGIMRGREFLMKDLYSFSPDEATHQAFYEKAKAAYRNIFEKIGIGHITYITHASGGSFSKFSHEFQTITDAGEDIIYIDEKNKQAVNKEIWEDAAAQELLGALKIDKAAVVQAKSVEVGNIFSLGTRFSDALGLTYLDEKGQKMPVVMGSYGIGIGRVMGTVAEVLSDENGLVWPASIAPFDVHLVALHDKEGKVKAAADALYEKLTGNSIQGKNNTGKNGSGIEVLYDDRDLRPGEKFADSDLIGIPVRVIVSEKNLAEDGGKGVYEIKYRKGGKNGEVKKVSEAELLKMLAK